MFIPILRAFVNKFFLYLEGFMVSLSIDYHNMTLVFSHSVMQVLELRKFSLLNNILELWVTISVLIL